MTEAKLNCYSKTNTNHEYHSDVDILSSSMLKYALESPSLYIQKLLESHVSTKSMDYGTLLHALILEPETVPNIVAIYPDEFSRTKESMDFKAKNANRYCITLTEFMKARLLASKVLDSKFRGKPFYQYVEEGISERSIYYTDPTTKIECRTRLDLDHDDAIFDLKTTRFADITGFDKQAINLNYDLSAYMYAYSSLLLENKINSTANKKPKEFIFISLCTEAPHSVFFRKATDNFLLNGMKKYQYALSVISSCAKVQSWPTFGGEEEIDITPWNSFTPPSVTLLTSNA